MRLVMLVMLLGVGCSDSSCETEVEVPKTWEPAPDLEVEVDPETPPVDTGAVECDIEFRFGGCDDFPDLNADRCDCFGTEGRRQGIDWCLLDYDENAVDFGIYYVGVCRVPNARDFSCWSAGVSQGWYDECVGGTGAGTDTGILDTGIY